MGLSYLGFDRFPKAPSRGVFRISKASESRLDRSS
ncbi:hypothetical protein CCACVL1_28992 [Corchorus capsularis]|uniref:Uncharacterized protein n=1 Tax=Corchorus capsularis TaxID=210143 RepID=A0A1R3G4B6_COCAP|nr:hypothetical protein CCACVL1_28992 [Corchorus capsularis]